MSAQRFVKKPVEIEAMQWDGTVTSATAVIDWMLANDGTGRFHDDAIPDKFIAVDTREGTMRAQSGDWIIRGVKGEFYPCKNEIFLQTYEPADDVPLPAVSDGEAP